MGFVKQYMLRQQDAGYSWSDDKYVCLKCISDKFVQDRLTGFEERGVCDYCGRTSPDGISIAVDVEELIRIVAGAIRREFADPVDELPYETREGGYQGNVIEGADILDEISDFTENDELFIANLAVFREYRGRGIAGKLLGRVQESAREKGLAKLSLYTEIDNDRAIGVYEKFGFKKDKKAVFPKKYHRHNIIGFYKMVKII